MSRRNRHKYSSAAFRPIAIGPHGSKVRVYERGRSGKAYLSYRHQGRIIRRATGHNLYTEDGQLDPRVQEELNTEQKRVLGCLLQGEDPYRTHSPAPGTTRWTLLSGFQEFLGKGLSLKEVTPQRVAEYRRALDRLIVYFSPSKPLFSLTEGDMQGYCTNLKALIGPSGRGTTGTRQAEVDLRCVLAVLRWLQEDRGVREVSPLKSGKTLRSLMKAQDPHRPRYSDEEMARFRRAQHKADPRVALLLAVQLGQRAGQVRQCTRRSLSWTTDPEGRERINLLVPGKKKKRAGNHALTVPASDYLAQVLRAGYLRELETEYRQHRLEDYPLFPGGIGSLSPGEVIPPGNYPLWDRSAAGKALRALEALAGVPHQRGRGFHGFRRQRVDYLKRHGATPGEIQAAGGWSSSQIPDRVYWEGVGDDDRRRSADILEPTTLVPVRGRVAASRRRTRGGTKKRTSDTRRRRKR